MGKSFFVFAKNNSLHTRLIFLFSAIILLVPSVFVIWARQSFAAQITTRSLTLSSAVPSASATYTFGFTVPTTGTVVKSFSALVCTVAVGTCSQPSGFTVTGSGINQPAGLGATSGWTVSTATAGELRMSDASNASNPSGSQTVTFTTVTNPNSAYITSINGSGNFYVRLTTFSNSNWTGAIDSGTVAAAVVQSLQVAANVAEILQFCIGNTTVIDDTASPGTDCSAISGTSVNIGTLDPSIVNISPVSTNGGNSTNGIAMLRTNAANGATVAYRAIPAGSGSNHLGTLRLSGATCSASSGLGTGSGGTPPAASGPYTDGCIDAAGTTQNVFGAGVEQFGMTVSGVNCRSTTSYTCAYASGTNNLQQQTNYIGGTNSTTFGASAGKGFAWDESGSTQTIASSAASTIKQVDDEALILNFAATPSITTPFGSYTVQADFIAVPTY
jgi:hypothetical protein